MHQKQVSPEHLEEFRLSVEGDVTALAARKAKPGDIQRLHRILDDTRSHLGNGQPDVRAFIQADIELHITLAEITGNPVFTAVVKMVHETILGYYDRFIFRHPAVLEENYRDLCAIVDAVETGDSDAARRLARQHVHRFNRHLQEESTTAPGTSGTF
jgi:DNA-binding FadR family transcriptional regulator